MGFEKEAGEARLSGRKAAWLHGSRDERGSSLILALVFIVAVSLIITALATWALNDLNNTAVFSSARSLQNAAQSATEVAIQSIRYTPLISASVTPNTLNASSPSYCWGNGPSSELATTDFTNVPFSGGAYVAVWCSTAWNPLSTNTRVVTFSTCLAGALPSDGSPPTSAVTTAATACAANPTLQVIVTFDDYPPFVTGAASLGPCATYCGSTKTVNNWVWSPTVPSVTLPISPSSGSVAGGTTVSITGTGFVSGSTVSFIRESGGTPTLSNVVVASSSISINSSTSITAVAPAVTAAGTYFVIVTTPTGSSPYSGAGPIFTYS